MPALTPSTTTTATVSPGSCSTQCTIASSFERQGRRPSYRFKKNGRPTRFDEFYPTREAYAQLRIRKILPRVLQHVHRSAERASSSLALRINPFDQRLVYLQVVLGHAPRGEAALEGLPNATAI